MEMVRQPRQLSQRRNISRRQREIVRERRKSKPEKQRTSEKLALTGPVQEGLDLSRKELM